MNNTSEYAVGWFTLVLVNAGLAQSKGRSGWAWGFASLFLGPICTFLIVVLNPARPKKEGRRMQRVEHSEAEYQEAARLYRTLAKDNPAAYQPYVATTLTNLGNLYSRAQRVEEAETAYQETLQLYRTLANSNPATYRPEVATTLTTLAILYRDMERLEESEAALQQALTIYRELSGSNPTTYQPRVVLILTDIASLARRRKDAK